MIFLKLTFLIGMLCLYSPNFAFAQSPSYLIEAEYFVDSDPGQGNANSLLGIDGFIDEAIEEVFDTGNFAGLSFGVHTLYVRFKNNDGTWGNTFGVVFNYSQIATDFPVTVLSEPKLAQAEFFIDSDPGQGNGSALLSTTGLIGNAIEEVTNTFSASSYSLGLHTLYVRFRKDNGNWGDTFGVVFNIAIQGGNPAISVLTKPKLAQAEYFIDSDPGQGSGSALLSTTGLMSKTIEEVTNTFSASNLNLGLHTLYVRFRTDDGNWGDTFGVVFNIANQGGNPAISILTKPKMAQAEFFVDSDPGQGNGSVLLATTGLFGKSIEEVTGGLNASNYSLGLHTLFVRFRTDDGNWGDTFGVVFNIASQAGNPQIEILTTPTLTQAEYFLNSDPGEGNGITLLASGGLFDKPIEIATLDINNSTNPVPDGIHTLWVRYRNVDGTWGDTFGSILLIDSSTPPPTPVIFSTVPRNQKIILNWFNIPNPNLSYYKIYRSLTDGFTPTSSDSVGTVTKNDSVFVDTGLTNGTNYFYKITSVDNFGNESNPSLQVNAVPFNTAPSLVSNFGPVTVLVNNPPLTLDSLNQKFIDIDDDPMIFETTSSDSGIVTPFIVNGRLQLHFTPDSVGSAAISVTASDGLDTTWVSFLANVSGTNNPPILANALTDLNLLEDFDTTFVLLDSVFTDPEFQSLSFLVTTDGNTNGVISEDTLYLNSTKDFFSTSQVVIFASDGTNSVSDTFVVNVLPVNDSPILELTSNLVLFSQGNESLNLNSFVTDVDTDTSGISFFSSVLSTTNGNVNDLSVSINSGIASFSTILNDTSTFWVEVSAIDDSGGISNFDTLKVEVHNLTAISDLSVLIDGNDAELSWSPVPGAILYRVYGNSTPNFIPNSSNLMNVTLYPNFEDDDALLKGEYYYLVTSDNKFVLFMDKPFLPDLAK